MSSRLARIDEYAFAAAGLAGAAGRAALDRARSLCSAAPRGNALAALAGLSAMSEQVSTCFAAGAGALARGDEDSAASELARALRLMGEMAMTAMGTDDAPAAASSWLKRRRGEAE